MKKFYLLLIAVIAVCLAACGGKSGNTVDDLLDSYENYVKDYISYIDENPGQESATKAIELLNDANDLSKKLQDRKDEFTKEQRERLANISSKLAEKVQEKSGLGSSFDGSSSSDFGGDLEKSDMFGSDSE